MGIPTVLPGRWLGARALPTGQKPTPSQALMERDASLPLPGDIGGRCSRHHQVGWTRTTASQLKAGHTPHLPKQDRTSGSDPQALFWVSGGGGSPSQTGRLRGGTGEGGRHPVSRRTAGLGATGGGSGGWPELRVWGCPRELLIKTSGGKYHLTRSFLQESCASWIYCCVQRGF